MASKPLIGQRPYSLGKPLEMVEYKRTNKQWTEVQERGSGLSRPGFGETFTTHWWMRRGLIKPSLLKGGDRRIVVRGSSAGADEVPASDWHAREACEYARLNHDGGLRSIVARGRAYQGIPARTTRLPFMQWRGTPVPPGEEGFQIDDGSVGVYSMGLDKPDDGVYLGEIFVAGSNSIYGEIWVVSEDYASRIPASETTRADQTVIALGKPRLDPVDEHSDDPFGDFLDLAHGSDLFTKPSTFLVTALVSLSLHTID